MELPSTLVVSAEPFLRLGIRTHLEQELRVPMCYLATCGVDALVVLDRSAVGLIIVANTEHGGDTPRLVKELHAARRHSPLIVVTRKPSSDYVRRVMQAGARGIVTGLDELEEMGQAVGAVLRGGMHVSPSALEGAMCAISGVGEDAQAAKLGALSNREMEVFELIGQGLCSKEISSRLNISPRTVETHKMRMKEKLRIEHASQLSRAAVNHSLRAG